MFPQTGDPQGIDGRITHLRSGRPDMHLPSLATTCSNGCVKTWCPKTWRSYFLCLFPGLTESIKIVHRYHFTATSQLVYDSLSCLNSETSSSYNWRHRSNASHKSPSLRGVPQRQQGATSAGYHHCFPKSCILHSLTPSVYQT